MSVKKEKLTLVLTKIYIDALAQLVEEGVYIERQVAIRDALRHLFVSHKIPPFYTEAEEAEDP